MLSHRLRITDFGRMNFVQKKNKKLKTTRVLCVRDYGEQNKPKKSTQYV